MHRVRRRRRGLAVLRLAAVLRRTRVMGSAVRGLRVDGRHASHLHARCDRHAAELLRATVPEAASLRQVAPRDAARHEQGDDDGKKDDGFKSDDINSDAELDKMIKKSSRKLIAVEDKVEHGESVEQAKAEVRVT